MAICRARRESVKFCKLDWGKLQKYIDNFFDCFVIFNCKLYVLLKQKKGGLQVHPRIRTGNVRIRDVFNEQKNKISVYLHNRSFCVFRADRFMQ